MTSTTLALRDLVAVDADFKPSVQLPLDFEHPEINGRLVRGFIPTTQSIELLTEIAQSLDPNSPDRARTIVGTFGTGKSDLLLIICNYFARQADDPLMAPFYERLRGIDPARAGIIRSRREGQPPFLVVLLQADTVSSFPGFVLHGLQQALERADLPHLMNKTRYAAAREQIEAWQCEQHPRYHDFCKLLEDHEKIDVNGLVAALSSAQSDDALDRFRRTFKAVTGSDFHIYGYGQPHEAYAGVSEALVATGRFSGILLVCDEFTAFFERFQSAIDQQLREFEAETKAVENLAERSGSSGRAQVHFIVASLESFASAAATIGSATVAKATERSGGRFKQHSLMIQGSEELIRGAIKRLPTAASEALLSNAQRDELLVIAGEIGKLQQQWRDRDWIRRVIVEGSFPLHPLSTYALPLINQKVAQSQRTMFLFLKDERGLRGFIQREQLEDAYPDWHKLLTIDLLFDYFRESIITKHSDIHEAFERAEQQIRTAASKELALRVLKIVALCETIGSDLVLRPTRLFLRRALNLPPSAEADLELALNMLEQVDAIEAPSELSGDAGVYRLPVRGWVSVKNLRQRITNRAQNLSATDVSKLQAKHPPEPVEATEYNRKRGSHRRLGAYFVGLSVLRSRERLKSDLEDPKNRDGLLWYVVAASDAERAEAQSLARELTAQQSRLVVAVPVTPSHVLSAVRDYEALEALRRDPELDQVSKPYLEDKGKVGREYKERLDHELKQLAETRQWEWFAAGRGQPGLSHASLVQLASRVMETVFPETPATNLAQHFKPGDAGNPVLKAVEQLLKGELRFVKGAKGPTESMLRTGAVALGLLQPEKVDGAYETFSLADPGSSASLASGKIWRRMSEHLAAGKPWAQLVRDLRQPPFGLYDSILMLFLAAFVTRNAESVAVFKAGAGTRPSDIVPALLKAMLERPQDYTVRYQSLSEPEKRWLRGVVERGLRVADFNFAPGTTLRAAVATRFKGWLTRQQLPIFALTLSEPQLAELLPDGDQVTINAIALLLKAQQNDDDLATVLLTDIPLRLGAPEHHEAWDQATVDALLASWCTVCELLAALPVVLRERTVRRAAALFGAEAYEPEVRWGAITRWRLNRGAIPSGRLQGLAQDLFRFTNLGKGSIEALLLDEFARKVVTVGVEYQRWQDLDKLEKVFVELTRARDEINRAWEEVAQGDEIWREGLVRLVSGRTMSGVTADQAAAELAAWTASVAWPACARTLTKAQLHAIYSEVGPELCKDLAHLLARSDFDQQRWRVDLVEMLPREFAIVGWTRAEVNGALKRLEAVLPLAASLESRLRRHVLEVIARRFGETIEAPPNAAPGEVIALWRERFPIPEPNDLSAEAKSLLFHVGAESGDVETLLLMTLPRALAAVARPVRQWERYDLLERFETAIRRLLSEIAGYEPASPAVYAWLIGVVQTVRQAQPVGAPRERKRLTELVVTELGRWLGEQQLPPFLAHLSAAELGEIVPHADPQTGAALRLLLSHATGTDLGSLVKRELPQALGIDVDAEPWSEAEPGRALSRLEQVCRLIETLPEALQARLLTEIGQIFGAAAEPSSSAELLRRLRDWRAGYIILPTTAISPDARLLYDTLGRTEDDAQALLLQRLPTRISEVRAAYGRWSDWSTRERYLQALRTAADEIVHHGSVGRGSTGAEAVWCAFCEQLRALSDDDKRWIVKTFRDEFQQ